MCIVTVTLCPHTVSGSIVALTASFSHDDDDDDGRHIPCLSGHLIHKSTERGEKNTTKYRGNINDKKQMKDVENGRRQQN